MTNGANWREVELSYPYINGIKAIKFIYKYSTNLGTNIARIPYYTAPKSLLLYLQGGSSK